MCKLMPLLLLLAGQSVIACTTFFINKNGQLVFGRNYDWVTGKGAVNTNLRGLAKTSFQMGEGKTISWVSKYGSTTFNQYGKEFPTGGMNEKGLVVEMMWLDGSEFPKADDRATISVLQWIQYQLDNAATIDEVIASDKVIRISQVGTTPVHYLVADKTGKAATIEFLNGKMTVHRGNDLPFPVLTNNTYSESVAFVKRTEKKNEQESTFQGNSLGRFATACKMVNDYGKAGIKGSVIDYSFKILDAVGQREFTKWSIVYDIGQSKIYFKTQTNKSVRYVDFSDFDFACSSRPMTVDMNIDLAGDLKPRFEPYSPELNVKLLEASFEQSRTQIGIAKEQLPGIIRGSTGYSAAIRCQ